MGDIIYKTSKQLSDLKISGKYLTELLYLLYNSIKPGVNGIQLEKIAENYINKHNLKGAFKGYHGFPTNLCVSINSCVVHGIPNDYIFREGDLVKIDAGIIYNGMISDAAFSKIVGGINTNQLGYDLIKTTKKALDRAFKNLKIGNSFYKVGKIIYDTMKEEGFSVIKTLTGHGVGVKLHELPYIYNYPYNGLKKIFIKNGMSFAIEPITAIKSTDWIEKNEGDWPLYCKENDLGAQWEYTIIVKDNNIEIVAGITENLFN